VELCGTGEAGESVELGGVAALDGSIRLGGASAFCARIKSKANKARQTAARDVNLNMPPNFILVIRSAVAG
jgi:autotransporter translocation and assembly factor TamB